jgi:hypothetical protein
MTLQQLIYSNLIKIHKKSGFKKSFVAQEMGISRAAATHFFSGRRIVPLKRIGDLARIYGINEIDFVKVKKK